MKLLAVNYHYFRESTYSSGIYPSNLKSLAHQIEQLQRQYVFVSQSEIASWLQSRDFPQGNFCVLTFDDGLQEQMAAFDFLEKKGIPAIFFVPTAPIQTQKVLPVHQLHFVRTRLPDSELFEFLRANSNIAQHPFDNQLLENQYRYDNPLSRQVKYYLNFVLQQNEREAIVQQLFDNLVSDEAEFAGNLYMREADLRRLAEANALGAHGSAHVPLASIPPSEAAADIAASVEYLENVGHKKIVSFSYPFGGKTAVSSSLGPMLEKAGIQFAFTMERGINHADQLQNPLFLRRVDTNDAPGGKNPLPEW